MTENTLREAYLEGFEDGVTQSRTRAIWPHLTETADAAWEASDTANRTDIADTLRNERDAHRSDSWALGAIRARLTDEADIANAAVVDLISQNAELIKRTACLRAALRLMLSETTHRSQPIQCQISDDTLSAANAALHAREGEGDQ